MFESRPVRVIAVTGGKGGVGKTNVAVNLGVALAEMAQRVVLLDADLGLANIDIVLGLHPPYNLSHVVRGERTLEEIAIVGPAGLRLIPAASGIKEMAALSTAQHAGLIHAFGEFGQDLDVLIVDTAAGISDSVISFSRAAQEVLMVVCDEPASITDAYALIKLLNREYGVQRFHILANMVQTPQEGRELYQKLCRVTDRYLEANLLFTGAIPFDPAVKKAIKSQKPVVQAFPRSAAAMAFRSLAQKTETWPLPEGASGYMQFFVERLLRPSAALTGGAVR
ncbi:MAG: MinD/ParA family protein [Pseudomonadota bacterium]